MMAIAAEKAKEEAGNGLPMLADSTTHGDFMVELGKTIGISLIFSCARKTMGLSTKKSWSSMTTG